MDQRLFLAIALSMLVLIGYYLIFPPPTPQRPPEPPPAAEAPAPAANGVQPAATATPAASAVNAPVAPAPAAAAPVLPPAPATPQESHPVRVDTPRYVAVLDTRGGTLTSFKLRDYRVAKENIDWADLVPPLRRWLHKPPVDPRAPEDMAPPPLIGSRPWSLRFIGEDSLTKLYGDTIYAADQDKVRVDDGSGEAKTLVLTGTNADGLQIEKRFTFHPDSYIVDYRLSVLNRSDRPRTVRLASYFGEGPLGAQHPAGFRSHRGPIWRADNSLETEDPNDVATGLVVRDPAWVGLTGTYFIDVAQPVTPISHAFYEAKETEHDGKKLWIAGYGMELPQAALVPGQTVTSDFKLYLGPKKVSEMQKFGAKLETSLDLTLDILARPMLALMRWFHSFVGNYGVAIILLTIVVRVLLFPLTYRGMLNIKRMQKLQPRMAALREKFKGDKERLNREMMAMYKKHKMNPLGGCLPIALQIPIFFALYSALLGAIELRHEPFIWWITDLSAKDGLYITPLLMGVSMLVQQRMTPTAMDPTQARIMQWMPVVFTFFMINFPSGLVVYWLTSNTLSVAQQAVINRIKVPEPQD